MQFVHEHRREKRQPEQYDCGYCQRVTTPEIRERMGCAYIKNSYGAHGVRGCDYETTVCPGWTMKLPQVLETISAHRHWEHGQLTLLTENPTRNLLTQIEIYDTARGHAEAYFMKPEKDR